MVSRYNELVQKLKEIFQLDQPELDFGIYRILHARADKISDFLENRLKQKVLELLCEQPEAESDVYSHLLKFFSRYYDKGDFISLRRYKGDTYAIPYSGEEVKLHWANADQYYIKSSEAFSNYSFSLDNGKKVHFKLLAADTAKDNTKDNDGVRRFVLWEPSESCDDDAPAHLLEEKDDGLYIYFRYVKLPKKPDDETKNSLKPEAMRLRIEQNFHTLGISAVYEPLFTTLAPTEKDKKRSLLEKHLSNYIAKNTSDYFIHKNLGAFLRNELDFYIKNEMMHLDDIMDASTIDGIGANLRKIKTVRTIASDLIDFMAQLEDFQKKLWLKKKFVVQCDYCVTMDMIPQELRAEVLANPLQLEEWKRLNTEKASLLIDARMVDTRFFDEDFKARLLTSIDNLDERCDGVIIHSENHGALELIKNRFNRNIGCIYIDPPYNTGSDNDFLYKDNYQHSSWLACMRDRFCSSRTMMSDHAGIWVSTDDGEYAELKTIMGGVFGKENFIADVIWNSRKSVSNDAMISVSTNHTTFFAYDAAYLQKHKNDFRLAENGEGFANSDNDVNGPWKLDPMDAPNIRENLSYKIVNPITQKEHFPPRGRCWRFTEKETLQLLASGRIVFGRNGDGRPQYKRYLSEALNKGRTTTTLWDDVSTTSSATTMLLNIFGSSVPKTDIDKIKPKPTELIYKVASLNCKRDDYILDYFAGSGTTGHAIINLNRDNDSGRKYIMIEVGDYFDTIIIPRLKKVVYSPKWKDGKPEIIDKGVSHCFKYMRLESYEDTLNNLEMSEVVGDLPGLMGEEYLLKYMLDIECRGSLINVDSFKKPFDYELRIAVDSSGAWEERKIDLVETFNYLLGLKVEWQHRRMDKGYVFVEGILPDGGRALVVWRDCEKVDNDRLNELIFGRFSGFDKLANDYSVIYVNGDHSIRNRKLGDEEDGYELKIRSLEKEFLARMFEEE